MNKPEISIITPVYNGRKYIENITKSVLSQTFKNFEWIIIDDCSNDGTSEELKKLTMSDSRVKLVESENNRGPIAARNIGLEMAAGSFIAFLDFDDIWPKEKLEKQIRFMKKNNLAMTYTGYKKFYDDGLLRSGITVPVPSKITYSSVIKSNSVIISTAMYDREKTGDLRQDINAPLSKDDMHFWLSVLQKCGSGTGMKEDLCRFRVHKDSITGNKMNVAKIHWTFYRDTMNLPFFKSVYFYSVYSVKGLCKYFL